MLDIIFWQFLNLYFFQQTFCNNFFFVFFNDRICLTSKKAFIFLISTNKQKLLKTNKIKF